MSRKIYIFSNFFTGCFQALESLGLIQCEYPIYTVMEIVEFTELQTRECPFCAETIQIRAIKCRFCGEFLNTNRSQQPAAEEQSEEEDQVENILFKGRPSVWGLTSSVLKAAVFVAMAAFLIDYPIENWAMFQIPRVPPEAAVEKIIENEYASTGYVSEKAEAEKGMFAWIKLNKQQKAIFARYRIASGIGFIVLITCILLLKAIKLKMIHYIVSEDRIEWSRGIMDRRVDNLDMFRVIDLSLQRSLLDCIFGIGTVTLITTDKTDPKFVFQKIRRSRKLYDVIKKASLDADRKAGVVHLE